MAEQKTEFRKNRGFGENLNDTFQFIKQNFKPLFKAFFAICSVFMITQAILNGFYQSSFVGSWTTILQGATGSKFRMGDVFNMQYFLVILFMLLTYIAMQVTVAAYIKYYVAHDGEQPGIDDVWAIFSKYFFTVLLYNIPVLLIIIAGTVFCFLPGIYLWVVFVPLTFVAVIEDKDFGNTFSRCFELIKENFWMSLGIYLVSYLIYTISGSIVGMIVSAIIGAATFFTTKSFGATYGIATSFLNIFTFCFYIIFLLSAAFNYFSLVESKDGTGIMDRINNIGNKNADHHNREEQY